MNKRKVPEGFVIVKRTTILAKYPYKRERMYFRCKKVDEHGRQCIYEIRSDKVTHINLQHLHQFELYFPSLRTTQIDTLQKEILNLQCDFISASNISLFFASSNYFKNYILEMLKIGNKISSDIDISQLTKKLTFQNYRRTIIKNSNKTLEAGITLYKNFCYASITIDSGTINKNSFFDIYLCNPGESLKPLLIHSATNHSKSSISIEQDIIKAIQFVKDLRVMAIVGDNFRAQVNACSKIIRGNMRTLYFIPCSCHLLNLIIQDVYKNNDKFCAMINHVRSIGVLYNKYAKQKLLNSFSPEHVPTRWVNDLDIAFFLYKKSKILHEIFNDNDEILYFIDNELRDLVLLLIPFRSALQMLEGNNSKIGDIYPVLEEFKLFYQDHLPLFQNEYSQIICRNFVENIDIRFNRTNIGHILQLAFILTPHGRNHIRTTLRDGTYVNDVRQVDYSFNMKFDKKYVNNFLIMLNSPWFKEKDVDEQEEEELEEDEEIEFDFENENNEEEDNECIDRGLYENCETLLESLSPMFGLVAAEVKMEFYNWIYDTISLQTFYDFIETNGTKNTSSLWRMLQNNGFPNLGEIARAMHSIIASETVCERGFSIRKSIQRKTRNRMLSDLANALVINHTNKD